jgi:colanic acid/amylovoran biosynthesis glycosyltransferase
VAEQTKLLYLIGQFPAINHNYLLTEIRILRARGLDISVVSVSPPDRPFHELNLEEREEAYRTYYIKSVPVMEAAVAHIGEFLHHPVAYLRALIFALQLARESSKRMAYHLAYFAEAILIGRHMRERGISHVHANFSATVSLIACQAFPVTMSFVAHGFGELHNPTETLLAERIRGSLFVRSVSHHGRGQMMLSCDRSDWQKLIYVPLGIEPGKFTPPVRRTAASTPQIICVGRLSPEKGQEFLLNALAILKAKGREVHLRLVGDGPDRAWLERRASELGIAAEVEFVGWVDPANIPALYAETDICVLTSLAEGLPIVLMEAMAMQVPCVAPRITGIPELIEHGVNGLLFALADVEDLSHQIETLLDSPELRERMGVAARALVLRDYDNGKNTERFAAELVSQLSAQQK